MKKIFFLFLLFFFNKLWVTHQYIKIKNNKFNNYYINEMKVEIIEKLNKLIKKN